MKIKHITLLGLAPLAILTSPFEVQAQTNFFNFGADHQLSNEDIQKIQDVYNAIQSNYIEEADKDTLLRGALEGMVNALGDPYSEYLDASESQMFDETIEGSFFGIGVQIMSQNGKVVIISPITDTPAEKAGLQPNDIILEADGTVLTDMDTNQVVSYIRGEAGTKVKLTIQRGSNVFEVEVERAEIPITSVTGELDENSKEIGFVQINQFSGTTSQELVEVVEDLRGQGAKAFIFDLRNNPGGLLDQAITISNMFLEDGQVVMQVQEKDVDPTVYEANDAAYGDFQITESYVVLINEGSASASEILSAAIQENTQSPLLGQTSFGKGTVQNITNESELGELKLTIAKWLTPNGTWIHDTGITPTIEVAPDPLTSSVLLNESETLQVGDANEFVKTAISILKALGYQVESDYLYDESVKLAVEAFQADKELTVDGIITGDTATQLNLAARDYLKENDPQYDKAVEVVKGLLQS
ncbi:TPA: S41 family peptidase [Streptococcus suis]